jgi:hypothetical protein
MTTPTPTFIGWPPRIIEDYPDSCKNWTRIPSNPFAETIVINQAAQEALDQLQTSRAKITPQIAQKPPTKVYFGSGW